MNKRLKLITSVLLMFTMVVSGSYVFAEADVQPSDNGEQAALEMEGEPAPQDEEQQVVEAVEENEPQEITAAPEEEPAQLEEGSQELTQQAAENISMEVIDEGESVDLMSLETSQTVWATTINYSSPANLNLSWKSYQYQGVREGCYPIAVKAKNSGKLWIEVKGSSNNTSNANIFVGKLNTSTTPYEIDFSYLNWGSMTAGDGTTVIDLNSIDVAYGETYYIGVESPQAGSFSIRAYVYPYGLRTLPASTYMMAAGYKGSYNDSNALFKIKPSKTGYIRVYVKEFGNSVSAGYVTLLNSSKKTISDKLWFYEGSDISYISFGVKKGYTYYLKASDFQGSPDNKYVYRIYYKNYAATLWSNSSRYAAKKLTRKASYTNVAMPATGNYSNKWYKFKVTKKRVTKIKIDATYIKSGTTKVTVYCGKKKIGTSTLSNGRVNTFTITYGTTYGKAKKGTYYVKVRKSGYASGKYRIKYAQ